MQTPTTKDVKILEITKLQTPKNFVSVGFPSLEELKKAIVVLGVNPLVIFHGYGRPGAFLPGTIREGQEIYYAYKGQEVYYFMQPKHIHKPNEQQKRQPREVLA